MRKKNQVGTYKYISQFRKRQFFRDGITQQNAPKLGKLQLHNIVILKNFSPDICFIRLDFETFVLKGPLTGTSNGICEEKFEITGGVTIPTICGTNTGQHCKGYY